MPDPRLEALLCDCPPAAVHEATRQQPVRIAAHVSPLPAPALLPDTLEQIGFLHITNFGIPAPGYPHPDAIHLVMSGRAAECAGEDWTDTEGFVMSSELRPLASLVPTMVSAVNWAFIEALRAHRSGR